MKARARLTNSAMDLAPAVICVDGMGTNGLATARSLGRRHVPVYVVAVKGDRQIVSASRYCSGLVETADQASLCQALLRLRGRFSRPPVLYIENDAMIRQLAPHAAELAQHFEVVEPIAQAERLTDKAFQLQLAGEAGIAVPRTWFPASWAELAAIGSQSGKRLIAKPSPIRLTPGTEPPFKALICPSAQALAAALRERVASPEEVLVQEYVEGADAQIRVGLSYRSRDGRCFTLSAQKLRQTQPGAGVMAVGRLTDEPQVRAMTRRLADVLAIRGVLSTEFKLDPTDGKLYFIEWNPRPAYFQSLGHKAGFELAQLAYWDHVDASRLPEPDKLPRQSSGHYWINFRADLQHLSVVPRLALQPATWRPYLSEKEWAVFAADDPMPWLLAMSQLGAALPKALLRLLAERLSGKTEVRVAH